MTTPAPEAFPCLVLGGGGAKGAFQVGALDYLVSACGMRFPLITGVSVGALNGAVLAQTPPGDLAQAIATLKTIWLAEIRGNDDVYLRRHLGASSIVLLKSDSLYDNTPLRRLVQRYLRLDELRASPTRFRVGRVSLMSGRYVAVDQARITLDDIIASTAFPYYFEPVTIDGEPWADGGLRNVAPIETGLEMLRDCAPPGSRRLLIAVLATPTTVRPVQNIDHLDDALKILERAIEILGAEAYEQDLRLADDTNRHTGALERLRARLIVGGKTPEEADRLFREAGIEPQPYPSCDIVKIEPTTRFQNVLDFSAARLRQAMENGWAAAAEAVKQARERGVPV